MNPSHVIIVAGPNGAGKSTTAPSVLRDALEVREFVNADVIAAGLSGFHPESVAVSAGRIMIQRMHELAANSENFAFETTLASRSFAPWLSGLKRDGYRLHLLFFWLSSADLAVDRVAERVRLGGHSVPEATIRRRYSAGLRNFFGIYMPLADKWQLLDNSGPSRPHLIAAGERIRARVVADHLSWRHMKEKYGG